MKTKIIYVNGLNDLAVLYTAIQQAHGDVMVTKGSYSIDGKSMEDLFNLDMKDGVIITYAEDEIKLDTYLDNFKESIKA